jgi:outer membrane biosynthesis protein TonB
MMKKLVAFIFSILIATSAWAQSADEYFHGGAQSFIGSDLQTAIDQIQAGLNKYPNNPKLNALMQKLQEEKEKQEQQQQNQDQQQDQKEKEQEEQENQEQQESEGENQEEQDPQEMNPEDMKPQQISKEDAEKILQALAQKEKELLKEFKKKKSDGSAKHDKDW